MKTRLLSLLFTIAALPAFSQLLPELIREDTLLLPREPDGRSYVKTDTKKGYREQRTISYEGHTIRIGQQYNEKEDTFSSRFIDIDGKRVLIDRFYRQSYGTDPEKTLYSFDNSLVVFRKYPQQVIFELAYAEWGCIGSFCLDAEILTIYLNNDGSFDGRFQQVTYKLDEDADAPEPEE